MYSLGCFVCQIHFAFKLLIDVSYTILSLSHDFVGTKAKDIVFRFIIEYSSSLRDFGP